MSLGRFARVAALAAIASLVGAGPGLAQDTPKDDALDRLLEKLEGKTADPSPEAKKDAPRPKPKDAKKDAPKPKPKVGEEPKDKALDSLLEKLGETKEAPNTTGRGDPSGDPADTPKLKGGDVPKDNLKEGQKPLDEHLEELTGRVKKKKSSDKEQQGEGQGQPGDADDSSPLGQAVKKMRSVESKLGEDETGEETRKTQGEIVKDLDTLIAQAKKSAQGQGKPGRRIRKQGPPNGNQPDNQPGTDPNARGAGPMKTADARNTPALVGDKNTWGNLPAMLRDEMENVFRTEMLPNKTKRISRYYDSIKKKSLSSSSRGE